MNPVEWKKFLNAEYQKMCEEMRLKPGRWLLFSTENLRKALEKKLQKFLLGKFTFKTIIIAMADNR